MGQPPKPATAISALRIRRSEEHTPELQSPCNLVCRLLLEKQIGQVHLEAPPPHRPARPPPLVHPPLAAHVCDLSPVQPSRRAGAVWPYAYATVRAEDAGSG